MQNVRYIEILLLTTTVSYFLALKGDRRIITLPPYLSFGCILVGVVWLFLLPLNQYSRNTYVSENALLPGQVHTYFGGSEHNVFRAYRQEVSFLEQKSSAERVQTFRDIFKSAGLKTASQQFAYTFNGGNASGENAYAILQGPRADATEAVVLIAAWRTYDDQINYSGVALVLTLARYFKRWSLWSKDIIFLIPEDSVAGPQAWADAYHDVHDSSAVQALSIKSGALQGAVAVEYPAGTWGHRFDKLHVRYDGTNGQLPNLDLLNTAVGIASGQMGIGCTIQRMWNHEDKYLDRLQTMLRGMLNQGLGHATGPHSAFIPYHVDAITLQTVGDGWQDEMSLGRTIEGLFRSLNNLLEHLHQSFFFYLLMNVNRFVSIGTYLPSAMLIAGAFTLMSIFEWVGSGWAVRPFVNGKGKTVVAAVHPPAQELTKEKEGQADGSLEKEQQEPGTPLPRPLFAPALILGAISFTSLAPLALFTHTASTTTFTIFTIITLPSPILLAIVLPRIGIRSPNRRELSILLCASLLLLGMFLSALATLNFSLSLIIGVLSTPLTFIPSYLPCAQDCTIHSNHIKKVWGYIWLALITVLSPMTVIYAAAEGLVKGGIGEVLKQAGFGWWVCGQWTIVIVWLVWWPAWWLGGYVLSVGLWGEKG